MFEESDSVLNIESIAANISYKSLVLAIQYGWPVFFNICLTLSKFEFVTSFKTLTLVYTIKVHRNFDSVDQR